MSMKTFYGKYFAKYGLSNIFLVTPQTAEDRIRKIDGLSNSFIYLLSSSSITGNQLEVSDHVERYFKKIKDMQLQNPTVIGFGISNHAAFSKACKYADAAIVGSAFVKMLCEDNDYLKKIPDFIDQIKNAPILEA